MDKIKQFEKLDFEIDFLSILLQKEILRAKKESLSSVMNSYQMECSIMTKYKKNDITIYLYYYFHDLYYRECFEQNKAKWEEREKQLQILEENRENNIPYMPRIQDERTGQLYPVTEGELKRDIDFYKTSWRIGRNEIETAKVEEQLKKAQSLLNTNFVRLKRIDEQTGSKTYSHIDFDELGFTISK